MYPLRDMSSFKMINNIPGIMTPALGCIFNQGWHISLSSNFGIN